MILSLLHMGYTGQEIKDAMEELKRGIGLRAYAQRDPVVEYRMEGFDMFEEMIGAIQEDTVKYCYNVTVETRTESHAIMEAESASKSEFVDDESVRVMQGQGQLPEGAQVPDRESKPETVRRDAPKVGRNDPCPCGSGKKYKKCCGANSSQA